MIKLVWDPEMWSDYKQVFLSLNMDISVTVVECRSYMNRLRLNLTPSQEMLALKRKLMEQANQKAGY